MSVKQSNLSAAAAIGLPGITETLPHISAVFETGSVEVVNDRLVISAQTGDDAVGASGLTVNECGTV